MDDIWYMPQLMASGEVVCVLRVDNAWLDRLQAAKRCAMVINGHWQRETGSWDLSTLHVLGVKTNFFWMDSLGPQLTWASAGDSGREACHSSA